MPTRARKHLTAWLGLVAMWIIVLAPIVSQVVVAAHRSNPAEDVLCSATQSAPSAIAHDHTDRLAACGYCDLLADHVAMPPIQAAPPALLALVAAPAIIAPASRQIPANTFPSGQPRAPPAAVRTGR